MNFSLNNGFCDKSEAESIIKFCIENGEQFSYNPYETWDCKRIYNDDFRKKIIDKLNNKFKNNEFNLWFNYNDFNLKNFSISLTSYYDGRYLNLHKDKSSELTTVIVLSDAYTGGQFALSDSLEPDFDLKKLDGISLYDLKLGDCISFNGSETYHGVMPVITGVRYALNIWMTDTNFTYPKIKNVNSLI